MQSRSLAPVNKICREQASSIIDLLECIHMNVEYKAVLIYNYSDGGFVGYGIQGLNKLQSTNIWTEGEEVDLFNRLQALNESNDIKSCWPHPQDPDVVSLLDDHNFHPIEYTVTDVIDKDRSTLVYEQIEDRDITGITTGKFVDGDIDLSRSDVVYKSIQIPKNPSDMKMRLQDAMETIARRRVANSQARRARLEI
jgi:hypothetical protein